MTQAAMPSTWIRVSKSNPCPVCGKGDWCGISPDGALACCMRIKSDRPARNGGWLHRIAGVTAVPVTRVHMRPPAEVKPAVVDWAGLLDRFACDTRTADVERLAASLGVSPDSLSRLGIVWAASHRAWAFPMRDSSRQTVGIRLRAENGQKWAVRGSRNGLFWPDDLTGAGPLLLAEGPTDVAALLDIGFDALGRPSCAGAVEMVVEAVQRLQHRAVVVTADTDGVGIAGADRLAQALVEAGHFPKVVQPTQGKDARAWVQAGATRAAVDAAIAQARYWRP